jgi:hypothetical protein
MNRLKFLGLLCIFGVVFAQSNSISIINSVDSGIFMLDSKNTCNIISGQIKNNSKTPQTNIIITADFFDKNKNKIGNGLGGLELSIVNPGEIFPFKVSSFMQDKICDSYKFKIISEKSTTPGNRSLKILNSQGKYSAQMFTVTGSIKNTSNKVMSDAKVACISFLDTSHKKIVGIASDLPKAFASIQPNEVVTFETLILDPKHVSKTFSCQVEAK